MSDHPPSLVQRLGIALRLLPKILSDAQFAAAAHKLTAAPGATPPPSHRESLSDSALQLLGLLQQQGRLVDFLQEEITPYTDAQIGATVRVVHEGCRRTLHEHFCIEPIRDQEEGTPITLEAGYDASAVRASGRLVGDPPFSGTLIHRGWRATEVKLPRLSADHDTRVLAPAEVEL